MTASCSIDISRPPVSSSPVPTETISAASSSSRLPTTPVPVSWDHLNLTGKLIYLSSARGNNTVTGTVQMLDLATGEVAVLLSIPDAWVFYATISPDAKWLVMSYIPPTPAGSVPNRILYIMPLDGTAPPRPLFTPPTANDRYIQAEWSPDGKYIYFVHYNTENQPAGQIDPYYDILRMSYPDGKPEKIADSAFWPRLSPDATKLAYIYVEPGSGKNELFVANADGSNARQVALSGPASQEIIDAPVFSPDGESILFSVPGPTQSYQPGWFEQLSGLQVAQAHSVPSDWWSVRITGGPPTQLTQIRTINLFASISPDQQHIASVSGEGLFVMDLDGARLTRLVSDPEVHGTVSWIP